MLQDMIRFQMDFDSNSNIEQNHFWRDSFTDESYLHYIGMALSIGITCNRRPKKIPGLLEKDIFKDGWLDVNVWAGVIGNQNLYPHFLPKT